MRRVGIGILVFASLAGASCTGSDGSSDRRTPTVRITDDSGRTTRSIAAFDGVMVSLKNREPRTHYDFTVTPSGQAAPIVAEARLTTDGNGYLPPAILMYDVGQGSIPVGSYDLRVTGPDLDTISPFEVGQPTRPYIYSCDGTGEVKNTFDYGDPLHAAGGNFPPDTEVHLIPILDRTEYRDGDDIGTLTDPGGTQGRMATIVTTDSNGDIRPTELMNFYWFGMAGDGYDIVADLDPFDVFNVGRDAVDGHAVTGATYQVPDVGTDVDSDLACNKDGEYVDAFTTEDDIYVRINPPLQYVIQHGTCDKYVVDHRDEWQDGETLTDVSGGNEMDGLQSGCTNEGVVIIYPGPALPGDYDIILDIDRDGVYTQGVDIVDGGSAESTGTVGFTVN